MAAPAAPVVSAQAVPKQRDWALLQAYKNLGDNPTAVLDSQQLQGLDDDEDVSLGRHNEGERAS
eukprot:7296004-Prymnesium_polylepis.1